MLVNAIINVAAINSITNKYTPDEVNNILIKLFKEFKVPDNIPMLIDIDKLTKNPKANIINVFRFNKSYKPNFLLIWLKVKIIFFI